MFDAANLVPTLLERLERLPVGHALDLRTYKRNRSVIFVRQTAEDFLIIQDGFVRAEHRVALPRMVRLLKTLIRQEFPRSHKVRVYDLGPYEPGITPKACRKTV